MCLQFSAMSFSFFSLSFKQFFAARHVESYSDGREFTCDVGDLGSIPGLGRPPGEGNGNPHQNSGLENSMVRGTWQAPVHGVAKESNTAERLTHRGLNPSSLYWKRRVLMAKLPVKSLCYSLHSPHTNNNTGSMGRPVFLQIEPDFLHPSPCPLLLPTSFPSV